MEKPNYYKIGESIAIECGKLETFKTFYYAIQRLFLTRNADTERKAVAYTLDKLGLDSSGVEA